MKTINPEIQQSIYPSAAVVRLFASAESWIEEEAVRQLYAVSKLQGVRLAIGFPDLHPGKGAPIGAAFVTEDLIYPHFIGGDVGCGMTLFKTDLLQRDVQLARWAGLRFDLEHPWEGDCQEFLTAQELDSTEFDEALGTIGGGNHFAELQCVEEVLDAHAFKRLGMGKQQLVVLVHSGSHGVGQKALRDYVAEHGNEGVSASAFAGHEYLRRHDEAARWAQANRELIAKRFIVALGAEAELVWDGCHNSITPLRSIAAPLSHPMGEGAGARAWVHRRGAAASDGEFVVIPGSRGSLTYVVKPIGDGESHAWSLAHGAGRKWARSQTRQRIRERFEAQTLTHTGLGSRVICEDRDSLYEEAPAAYKNIAVVIQDLVQAGLVSVIATLRPILTYKTRATNR